MLGQILDQSVQGEYTIRKHYFVAMFLRMVLLFSVLKLQRILCRYLKKNWLSNALWAFLGAVAARVAPRPATRTGEMERWLGR